MSYISPPTIDKPLLITTQTHFSVGYELHAIGSFSGPSGGAWPTANKAIYVPFYIPKTVILTQFFWGNGSSTTNNCDIGIFKYSDLTKIISTGSTARSGTDSLQFADVTDTVIPGPARYYIGVSLAGTTGHMYRYNPSLQNCQMMGVVEETSAFALPSTATPVALSSAYIPFVGFQTAV